MTYIDLSNSSLGGSLPLSWLRAPAKLEVINLAHNKITGSIPGVHGIALWL
jgi:hypothetical protein